MTNAVERKFSSMISKRNSDSYPVTKSKFYFFLILLIGFLLGVAVFHVSSNNSFSTNLSPVEKHLKYIFSLSDNFADRFIDVIKLSELELCHVFFIFISGFTYFCFIASGAIIFAKGFMLGVSTSYLMLISSPIHSINAIAFGLIFFLSKFIICIITTTLASKTYIFSYDFRVIKQNCSILRRASVTYKFVFLFIKALGGCLLLNFIYCALIKLL